MLDRIKQADGKARFKEPAEQQEDINMTKSEIEVQNQQNKEQEEQKETQPQSKEEELQK